MDTPEKQPKPLEQCSDCGKPSKHLVKDLDGNPVCPVCREYHGD